MSKKVAAMMLAVVLGVLTPLTVWADLMPGDNGTVELKDGFWKVYSCIDTEFKE